MRRRGWRARIRFAAGQCVGYDEVFKSGKTGTGANTCALAVAAPAFELHAGGGPAAVAATSVMSLVTAAVPAAAKYATTAIGGSRMAAPPVVPEYSFKQFKATMKGAKYVRPETTI